MKRYALLIATVFCTATLASILLAQDAPKGDREGAAVRDGDKPKAAVNKEGAVRKEGQVRKEAAAPRLPEPAAKMDKAIGGFSEDQKARIIELNKAREAAVKEANAKFHNGVIALMDDEQKAKWEQAAKQGAKKDGQAKVAPKADGQRPDAPKADGER